MAEQGRKFFRAGVLAALIIAGAAHAQVPLTAYVNFEGAQTNPIRISADGTRLYAVNTPDARLSVFDITQPSSPALIAEVPVGIEPVSVNPRTNDEVWVVNQESDSISVVSVSKGIVTDTLHVKDEPMDVVFAGSNAFITLSRSNAIGVFNTTTHKAVSTIPLLGANPRAMALSPDGSKVYAAFALSGNHSTILPSGIVPQPPPTNPLLPPAPPSGLIIDVSDPKWASVVHTVPDNDVAIIDTSALTVTGYYTGVGTINLGIAVRPVTGDIYVATTNALNLVPYEPNLRGHFINNGITRILAATGAKSGFDLNPGINYTLLPNPAALTTGLSQPTSIVFDPGGTFMYVAAFGTDRVAKVGVNGAVQQFLEIGPATGAVADPANKRGPRGLALNAAAHRLYVMNRISNTISIVNTPQFSLIGEIPTGSFDPTPTVIRVGRGFLYDAKLSGNGTGSCAACHVDGDMDMLAWNLGDPNGDMATVVQNGQSFEMHPMKGAMMTLTLRGLTGLEPYHWRGDRADFNAFNPAFSSLMGGPQLSDSDMSAFTAFINTLTFQPIPYQNLDRTPPVSLAGGDPVNGQDVFLNMVVNSTGGTCASCHALPGAGTDLLIRPNFFSQNMKTPELRNMYQKQLMSQTPGAPSLSGYGFDHNGEADTLYRFLSTGAAFPLIANDTTAKLNLMAFMLSFDTGTAPAVGYTTTITSANASGSALSDLNTLQAQAVTGNIDLIAKGTLNGHIHGLLYQPVSNNYEIDAAAASPLTTAQILALIRKGDTVSFMGVPPGSGVRMGIDRNLDGILDGDQPSGLASGSAKH